MFICQYPEDYTIVAYDNLEYSSSMRNVVTLHGHKNFHFVKGDITSEQQVIACLQEYKIDTVFHAAAQTHVDTSFSDPYLFTRTNVFGTHTPYLKRAGKPEV